MLPDVPCRCRCDSRCGHLTRTPSVLGSGSLGKRHPSLNTYWQWLLEKRGVIFVGVAAAHLVAPVGKQTPNCALAGKPN